MIFRQKLHSHGWYILFNSLILIAVSLRYLSFLPEWPVDFLGNVYLVVSVIGQMTLLAAIFGALSILFLFLPGWSKTMMQATVATLGISALFIDTSVFSLYRFHINFVVLNLVLSGQIVTFPWVVWATVIGGVSVLFAAELWLIRWLDTRPALLSFKLGRKFALIVFCCLLSTNLIHIWASANVYRPVTTLTRYLPLFYPATANSLMRKMGWVDREAIDRKKAMRMQTKTSLNYPLNPLETSDVKKPVNIMLLAIDTWRADAFSQEVTPNMWQIAHQHHAARFNNHLSTGNATRAGIFGLFNGIPSTYWQSFLANTQPSLLIQRLQALNYNMGIFTSARLNHPEFDKTVFASIPNVRIGTIGGRNYRRDQKMTKDWINWYKNRDKTRPTFSFLFYDAVHGFDFPPTYPHKFTPMWSKVNHLELNNDTDPDLYFNLYKNSVNFVDSLVKKVFAELQASGELDNTLVILTSDHGEEMNDNKLNFWGHNGNFTDAQVKVPFVVFGPGFDQSKTSWDPNTVTSHADMVPTLMKHYLGVTNPVSDYSTGVDLLGEEIKRDWIISAKYSGYAIITKDTILEVLGSGDYSLMDKTNRPLKDQNINYQHVQQALEQISRYYR
ncbi:Inner membrane protein YejM [Vibrio aerogenes CECT 7868]|uniref:Inner membrane protein YejM n=1 Tax=Vibrio aerogenes CECT 7868 TaxID=1216006 RepID=A0A1M5Z6P1_9VIBR|nr:DUF3413 domain-containing protein [Vibrio aerogenes]SHI19889.1 Inner membrane protein YejM [Vibrio aerogenes CECT 7868]